MIKPIEPDKPETLEDKSLRCAIDEVTELLNANWKNICLAYSKCMAVDDEEEFKFNIGARVTMQPEGTDIKMSARINYGIKYTAQCEPVTVSTQPELFK